ncbi:MAG: thioredoxin family protein [Planctomycetaceae bacterium]|nr:MAG: thioredoxin family protein [Planctomycetaceae bacterium]
MNHLKSPLRNASSPLADPGSVLTRRQLARVAIAAAVSAGIQLPAIADEPRNKKSKFNRVLAVGDAAPEFDGLLGTDGKRHSLAAFAEAKAVVVMFIRNLCPTTHVYEPRLLEFAKAQAGRGVEFVAISISRNPAEGLDRMAVRAKEKQYPWPYLHDESQFTGKIYGASVTPQFFVLDADRKIAYMGAFDDNFVEDKVEKRYVADAVQAILTGRRPPAPETLARGCDIEYAE